MIKAVYLGLLILEISKIVMHEYEFWYDYVKPEYEKLIRKIMLKKTDGFIIYIKTEDIYVDIAKDIEIRFDTSNYEFERQLLK